LSYLAQQMIDLHKERQWLEGEADLFGFVEQDTPSPEQVLNIRPSPELQTRVSELLHRSKKGQLSQQEEAELERYLMLEHLVRLAKAHAYKQPVAQP